MKRDIKFPKLNAAQNLQFLSKDDMKRFTPTLCACCKRSVVTSNTKAPVKC